MPDWVTLGLKAIVGLFDFVNPWSKRWADKADKKDAKNEKAQNEKDAAVKNQDWKAFDNGRANGDSE